MIKIHCFLYDRAKSQSYFLFVNIFQKKKERKLTKTYSTKYHLLNDRFTKLINYVKENCVYPIQWQNDDKCMFLINRINFSRNHHKSLRNYKVLLVNSERVIEICNLS